jgi:hypothetical protein
VVRIAVAGGSISEGQAGAGTSAVGDLNEERLRLFLRALLYKTIPKLGTFGKGLLAKDFLAIGSASPVIGM